jgi:hypothetical protein
MAGRVAPVYRITPTDVVELDASRYTYPPFGRLDNINCLQVVVDKVSYTMTLPKAQAIFRLTPDTLEPKQPGTPKFPGFLVGQKLGVSLGICRPNSFGLAWLAGIDVVKTL